MRVGVRQAQAFEPAGAGQEAGFRILGVQAHFDRVAVAGAIASCAQRQRFAGGDAQLPFDQVQAGHHLGDRMLDLQARVDLHEVEVARPVGRR